MLYVSLVRTPEQAKTVYDLAHEYIDWLRNRYPEMGVEIDTYLRHEKFDEQICQVLTYYNPPLGESVLAIYGTKPVGILMLKNLGNGVCEMNRLFVKGELRGLGVGRALVERIRARAIEMGFREILLNVLPRHYEAIPLYRSMGFVEDDRTAAPGHSDKAVFMKLNLVGFGE